MGLISWIILGLIAGIIASKIVKRTGSGLILDHFLGMIGASVGGFIFSDLFGMDRGRQRQHLEHFRLSDGSPDGRVDCKATHRGLRLGTDARIPGSGS
jgi:uncharacterized membrane protein YeaQ/YmgE (transglycosylase-associated protein family)